MRKQMKAILLLLLCVGALTGCSLLHEFDFTNVEQDTQSRLVTASVLSDDELYERAKKETKDSVVNVYSSTTLTQYAVENFMNDYPALAGKIVYHKMDDESEYPRLIEEIENGTSGIDLLLSHSDLVNELMGSGSVFSYFPSSYADKIDEAYRMPLAFMYSSTLFIYDTANGKKVTLDNVWELTEADWRGRILMKDPRDEQVNMNFLYMLASPMWTERLKTAYRNYYGKDWQNSNYESIAYEWIEGFLANCDFSIDSNTDIIHALAASKGQKIALVGYSKLRKLAAEERSTLGVFALDGDVDCFGGFAFGTYTTVVRDSAHPYTDALFINYLLSAHGFSNTNAWNNYAGYYSTNETIDKKTAAGDNGFSFWEKRLVIEDPNYIANQNDGIDSFIRECLLSAE